MSCMKSNMIEEPAKKTGQYKQTEVGLIPEDWRITEAGALFSASPDYGINAAAIPFDYNFPTYLRITDISENGTFLQNQKASVSHPLSTKYYLNDGDIVFARTGASVGKSYLYSKQDGPLVYAGFLIRCQPKKDALNPLFFKYWVQSKFYWDWILSNSMRSGQPGINSIQLKSLSVPLPPISEQTAIAEALSDADAMISSLEKLIDKKKKIKQGAMQELLRPKEGWVEMNLTDIVNYIHGKAHERDIVEEGRYTVVNSKFISSDGQVAKYSNLNNCPARKGDVLTVLSDLPNGKALAKCFLVDSDNKYAVNQRVCIWRTKGADPVFLSYILNRHKYFLGLDDGVSQTHILNKHIEGFRLMFPTDLKYQQESGIVLRKLDEEIHLLNTKLSKCQMMKQGMMQNLLTGKIRLV